MAEIVNLNQFRKKRQRRAAEKAATENRRRFGQTKDERSRAQQEAERAKKDLEDKRLE